MDDRKDNRGGRGGRGGDGAGRGDGRGPRGGGPRGDRGSQGGGRGRDGGPGPRGGRRDDRGDRGPGQDRPPRRDGDERRARSGGDDRRPRRDGDDRRPRRDNDDRRPRRDDGDRRPRGDRDDRRPRGDRDDRRPRGDRDDRRPRGDSYYRPPRGDCRDRGPRDDRDGDGPPRRTREDREREDRIAREGPRGDRREGRTHFRRTEGREPGRRERPGGARRPVSVEVRSGGKGGGAQEGQHWIFGRHAVVAALNNPKRDISRLVATEQMAEQAGIADHALLEKVSRGDMDHMLARYGADGTHGGIAAFASTLNPPSVEGLLKPEGRSLVVLLDQVSDPHNVGAVMRTAAAFGARAVIAPERNAAPVTGALAKAASGALESVPYLRPTNLARTLAMLKEWGYWRIGLDGGSEKAVESAAEFERVALVLGAEGKGLRRLTAENCDLLVRIPMSEAVESLNVSNAAAIACYEIYRRSTQHG